MVHDKKISNESDKSYFLPGVVLAFLIQLFAAFIDNSRGALMPMILDTFQWQSSRGGWFMTFSSLTSLLTLPFAIFLNTKLRLATLSRIIIVMGSVCSLLGYTLLEHREPMYLGAAIGLTSILFAFLCNILLIHSVAPSSRFRFFCAMQLMYGLGAFLAPQICNFVVAHLWSYPTIFLFSLALSAVCLLLSFFLKNEVREKKLTTNTVKTITPLAPYYKFALLLFAIYVPAEVIASAWIPTFLVKSKSWEISSAADVMSAFFALMAVTRFACSVFLKEKHEARVLKLSLAFLIFGQALGMYFAAPMLGIMGCVGPFFPLLQARVIRHDNSFADKFTGYMLMATQIGVILGQLLMSILTQYKTLFAAYHFSLVLSVLTAILLVFFFRIERKKSVFEASFSM